jgi:hypothetical protein
MGIIIGIMPLGITGIPIIGIPIMGMGMGMWLMGSMFIGMGMWLMGSMFIGMCMGIGLIGIGAIMENLLGCGRGRR